jgi:hypothetical protein
MDDLVPAQRYGPTSGVFSGVAGLLICAVAVVVSVVDGLTSGSLRFVLAALVGAVLIWAFLLRPRIVIESGGRTLLLRNPLVDVRVPLAAVKVVGVRAVTTVKTDDAHYEGVAVGHPVRKIVRGRLGPDQGDAPRTWRTPRLTEMSTQDIMTEQVLHAAAEARAQGLPAEPVERRWALPELVLLAVFTVALVVSFFV